MSPNHTPRIFPSEIINDTINMLLVEWSRICIATAPTKAPGVSPFSFVFLVEANRTGSLNYW